MACGDVQQLLVEGSDYVLDLSIGRIKFLSTGALGPVIQQFFDNGGCAVRVDYDCPGAPHILCPDKLDTCLPCNDDPILNISAEDSDTDRFLFNFQTRQRPNIGFSFQSVGCKRFCFSEVSQQDADLCAILQALECINDGWRDPSASSPVPPFSPPLPPSLFFNTSQTCTTFCPDGTGFGATIAAGRVVDRNQAQANRIAHSLACRLSSLQRVCIRTTALPTGCLDVPYSKQMVGQGGTPFFVTFQNQFLLDPLCPDGVQLNDAFPYIWTVIGGALPSGLSLSPCSGVLSGTPTQAGSFSVTIRAEDAIGSFQTKTFSLVVGEITDVSNLPDATEAVAYSHMLTANPALMYFWQFVSGVPPSWLVLNSSTGHLTGTPDEVGDFLFGISIESSDGVQCTKEFTLHVKPTVLAYWKMDEASGNRADSVGSNDLTPVGVPSPSAVPGVINDAVRVVVGVSFLQKLAATDLWVYQNGLTMAGWFKFVGPALSDAGTNGTAGFVMAGTGALFTLGGDAAGNLFAQATIPLGGSSVVVLSGVVINTFQFIRLWVDPVDGRIHCKINEGATQSGAGVMTFVTPIPAMNVFAQSAPLCDAEIDEVGIYGRVLTDAEGATIYNAGSGKTCCPILP